MTAEKYLKNLVSNTLRSLEFAKKNEVEVLLERPKIPAHGDLATNVAMTLAAKLRRNPREIAAEIVGKIKPDVKIVSKVEIAGAGFINFYLDNSYFRNALAAILEQKENFGRSNWGNKKRVQIEFVSANPTGPLNIVNARAATVGDVLGNIFKAVGFDAEKEYYVNDAGRQIKLLGMSVSARYMELLGKEEPFPEEGYHGDYIRDLAHEIINENGEEFIALAIEERSRKFGQVALKRILATQKEVLKNYRIDFDRWFHETSLRANDGHLKVMQRLAEKGFIYEQDGAKWFRASEFEDEKDRVLITSEGEPTYFLVDIAYHADKYERGFEMLYDLWGPDHHGYIHRMKAALVALGYPKGSFQVNIIQQVNLLENGELVKMSKRAGRIIEMKELIDDVGVDVARFFFLARRNQSPLDFDLDLAKDASDENPVFYVQYAHARICNVIKHAEGQGVTLSDKVNLEVLDKKEEMELIKKLLEFPEVISRAAEFLEPHRIPNYLKDLAAAFHRFYHHHRVVTEDTDLTKARLILVECTRIVLANALNLLGITAPQRM